MEKTPLSKEKFINCIKKRILIGISFGLFFPGLVSGGAISVAPILEEVSLEKGQLEASFPVTISNNTEKLLTLDVSVVDFGGLDEAGGVAFLGASPDIEKKYALASWMRLEANQLIIPVGEERTLKVTIENRENLSPGGHYGAVLFRYSNVDGQTNQQVAVQQVFSSLVFVKKTDGANRALALSDWEFSRSFFSFAPNIKLRFQNSGNIHLVPRGKVEIRDSRGRMVSKGVINESSALILPESFRVFSTNLFSVEEMWWPGKYELRIDFRYDGLDDVVERKEVFFLIPSRSLLLIGALLLVGWVLPMIYRRKRFFFRRGEK